MSSIGSIDGRIAVGEASTEAARAPAAAGAQLAKLESQLSDWVNCPSGKTAAGQAHIAEINRQIDALKGQMQKASEQQAASPAGPAMRLDGLGSILDVQA